MAIGGCLRARPTIGTRASENACPQAPGPGPRRNCHRSVPLRSRLDSAAQGADFLAPLLGRVEVGGLNLIRNTNT